MLEVRRRASFSTSAGLPDVDDTSQTSHADATYRDIASGSVASDNTGEQKIGIVSGVNAAKTVRISAVLPFQVIRRSADAPDYSVAEGVASWQNEEDEDIEWRVIADGDNGWILQVKDGSGDIGVVDWTSKIKTEQIFTV